MKPFTTLAQAPLPGGAQLTLQEHDGAHYLKVNGRQLMSTLATSSELLLAQLACERLARLPQPRILIGGLGFGFSLRRALELLGPQARVEVAELIPEVVAWNREFLGGVNGARLADPRVEVVVGDVFEVIRRAGERSYDAILLDVDNGPVAMVQDSNARLYEARGLAPIARALRVGGSVAVWSASEDARFVRRLGEAGFKVTVHEAKAHERAKQSIHRIYLAEWRPATPSGRRA